jgi:hypothetical protein
MPPIPILSTKLRLLKISKAKSAIFPLNIVDGEAAFAVTRTAAIKQIVAHLFLISLSFQKGFSVFLLNITAPKPKSKSVAKLDESTVIFSVLSSIVNRQCDLRIRMLSQVCLFRDA